MAEDIAASCKFRVCTGDLPESVKVPEVEHIHNGSLNGNQCAADFDKCSFIDAWQSCKEHGLPEKALWLQIRFSFVVQIHVNQKKHYGVFEKICQIMYSSNATRVATLDLHAFSCRFKALAWSFAEPNAILFCNFIVAILKACHS